MRRKVYTKDQILKAAYEVISKDGFSKFTARNIAKKMGISTQPIYLEFKNMQDLKNTLVETVMRDLQENVFPITHTGNQIVDLGLNYINFAQENRNLYVALFVDEYGGGKMMHEFSYEYFKNMISTCPEYADLSDEYIKALHDGTWITVTGIASLMSSGIIHPSQEQIAELIQSAVDGILKMEAPEKIFNGKG
ncbi:TetR family transcriptional regulator [Enterococcus saigonensis]|uniref:TetR family transcriptional regulator n=1 Tax=Enterococcus saigonensis TaxID=1805431 RepID=A0A679ICW7_9ENTE|nr:TetR/AcrR family transcriptional regulator [Enterococcus saigonensis]BCA86083.1 TetR family transcriptional regulator [Enterococcus saigonensis]